MKNQNFNQSGSGKLNKSQTHKMIKKLAKSVNKINYNFSKKSKKDSIRKTKYRNKYLI